MSDAVPGTPAPPLTQHSEVAAWLEARAPGRLALDIEGDGLFRYRARLCTLQLADAERTCVIDALEVDVADVLGAVLGDASVEKVVHDASFDARMLREAGTALRGVFDTAVAARFLGYPATGLAALLEQHFGLQLDKQAQQADWGARPLAPAALHYLHEDVRHLLPLAEALEDALREADVVEEFREECAYVLDQAAAETEVRPVWARVKGAADLRASARAVLRELAAVREQLAAQRDVPPGRLLPAGLLIELARRRPQSEPQLQRLLRRSKLEAEERAGLLEAIGRGLSAPDVPAAELARAFPPTPPPEVRALQKRRRAALTAFRTAEAERRGIQPQALLPGHCVKDLMALREVTPEAVAGVPGLGACRVARYGKVLVETLRRADEPPEA